MSINENIGLTGILPFAMLKGTGQLIGSSFLRVDCLVSGAPGFEKWSHGKKYDNLIFQKAYWPHMMEIFDGPKILDICDPDWITGHVDIIEIGNLVHAITCSSDALTSLLTRYFPDKLIVSVPDRLNLHLFPSQRTPHSGRAKEVAWFGYIHNAEETLEQLFPTLEKFNLRLTIIADKPYTMNTTLPANNKFLQYEDHFSTYELLKQADIVLNPTSTKAFYKYKSNNKSIVAWNLGVPVACTNDDIERLMDPHERNEEVTQKQKIVQNDYDIVKSIEQYRTIIKTIREKFF